MTSPLREIIGVLHVHTTASDGSATARTVAREAARAGLCFVGINDHSSLDATRHGCRGWTDGVFVLPGAEINDGRRMNHLLVYGLEELPDSNDTREQVAWVRERGGLAIPAHPFERGAFLPMMGSYPWTAGPLEGLSGVEVWNYMSQWKSGAKLSDVFRRLRHPDRFVSGPDGSAVELWLKVGGCAIGTPDAHGFRYGPGRWGMEVFPYRMLFDRLRTHLLLEEEISDRYEVASGQIIQALGRGRVFTSNHLLGDARGFRAVRRGEDIIISLPESGSVELAGPAPMNAELGAGRHTLRPKRFGRYLVTVRKEGRAWICCGLP
ncbi:hypothetical protein GF402_08915 [Candidatus Fermentibacteria bacterium]|nr:hypothetical protein [Candidatus Fermentibacteria bacterium]